MLADFVNELELQHPPEVAEISVPEIVLFKANMIQELLTCSLGIYLTLICQTFFFKTRDIKDNFTLKQCPNPPLPGAVGVS